MRFGGPIYTHLKNDQKIGYWSVFSNIVLVLVTFWLGLWVQDVISKRNANATGVLANAAFTQEVKPVLDSINLKYGKLCIDLASDLIECENIRNKDLKAEKFREVIYKDSRHDLLLEYCSEISYATCLVAPYMHYVSDEPFEGRATIIPIMEIMILHYEEYKEELKESLYMGLCDKKKVRAYRIRDIDLLLENTHLSWEVLNQRIKDTIRTSAFIEQFGLFTFYDKKFSSELKKTHNTFIRSIGDKCLKNCKKYIETPLLYNEGEDAKAENLFGFDKYYEESIAVIFGSLLTQAVANHVFMSNHVYYTQEISRMLIDSPVKSLLLVVILGVFLAWCVYLVLPKSIKDETITGEFDKQRYLKLKSDYDSELDYNDKLIKILKEHEIEVPKKED